MGGGILKKIRIAIGGCEESKWTNSQKVDAKEEIKAILWEWERRISQTESISYGEALAVIVLVSGHCPKGGVDIWAEEIADEIGIKKEIYPAEVNQWNDKIEHKKTNNIWVSYKLKGFRSRNIQIAEACDVLCCIVPWVNIEALDNIHEDEPPPFPITLSKNQYCIHCKQIGHPTNGGCWTMKYAKKLGKETHLVVIE